MSQTVLLTGVSGYIGLHIAQQLLNAGFCVRGSVRSKNKEKEVRETLAAADVDISQFSIVELNLTHDDGWDEAVKGCDYVMHVASPFVIANPKSEDDMIIPAVEGTLRALRSAKKAGVERVVLTSSILAMMGSMKTGIFGPKDWTDINAANISTYAKSKTLAEKAAWDFIESQEGADKMEMVSMHPGGVFGPPLGNVITGQSMDMLDQMLRGKMPLLPSFVFPLVDVRDVATLHVQAMITPDVVGKRIVASPSKGSSFVEVAQILKENGYKGPSTRVAPDFLLRFMSLFDREAQGMLGLLGMDLHADNAQTRTLFNWTPIPLKDSVLDSAAAVKAITRLDG